MLPTYLPWCMPRDHTLCIPALSALRASSIILPDRAIRSPHSHRNKSGQRKLRKAAAGVPLIKPRPPCPSPPPRRRRPLELSIIPLGVQRLTRFAYPRPHTIYGWMEGVSEGPCEKFYMKLRRSEPTWEFITEGSSADANYIIMYN